QPKSGRMMRSPGRVRRMMQIDSRTFNSPDDNCMLPSVPMRGGKPTLCPYKFVESGMTIYLSLLSSRARETNSDERQPPEDDVKHDQENDHDDPRHEERNRYRDDT